MMSFFARAIIRNASITGTTDEATTYQWHSTLFAPYIFNVHQHTLIHVSIQSMIGFMTLVFIYHFIVRS
jgi:hypothetical protein